MNEQKKPATNDLTLPFSAAMRPSKVATNGNGYLNAFSNFLNGRDHEQQKVATTIRQPHLIKKIESKQLTVKHVPKSTTIGLQIQIHDTSENESTNRLQETSTPFPKGYINVHNSSSRSPKIAPTQMTESMSLSNMHDISDSDNSITASTISSVVRLQIEPTTENYQSQSINNSPNSVNNSLYSSMETNFKANSSQSNCMEPIAYNSPAGATGYTNHNNSTNSFINHHLNTSPAVCDQRIVDWRENNIIMSE